MDGFKKNKLKLLHSIPQHDKKFDQMRELLFKNYDNQYVASLNEVSNIENYNVIVLHYLRSEDVKYLINNKISTPIIWFCWGADLFSLGKYYNLFLLPKTKQLRRKIAFKKSFKTGIKELVKAYYPISIDKKKLAQNKIEAFKRIDYMVPVVPGDFELLKAKYETTMKGFHLNLVNPLTSQENFPDIIGKNILLGNSASFTNNHIEAIDWLAHLDLKGRKVIIPLNYGRRDLADKIAHYAMIKLGKDRVQVLKSFMPFEEYNQLISSCEFVIMNHLRQQAVGNVVQTLLNGSHLYLREESTVYKFLQEHEFRIGCINKAKELLSLDKSDILYNRKKAKEIFGADRQCKELETLMKKIIS